MIIDKPGDEWAPEGPTTEVVGLEAGLACSGRGQVLGLEPMPSIGCNTTWFGFPNTASGCYSAK